MLTERRRAARLPERVEKIPDICRGGHAAGHERVARRRAHGNLTVRAVKGQAARRKRNKVWRVDEILTVDWQVRSEVVVNDVHDIARGREQNEHRKKQRSEHSVRRGINI